MDSTDLDGKKYKTKIYFNANNFELQLSKLIYLSSANTTTKCIRYHDSFFQMQHSMLPQWYVYPHCLWRLTEVSVLLNSKITSILLPKQLLCPEIETQFLLLCNFYKLKRKLLKMQDQHLNSNYFLLVKKNFKLR